MQVFCQEVAIFFSIPKKMQRSFLMIATDDLWSITKCAKSGVYSFTLSELMSVTFLILFDPIFKICDFQFTYSAVPVKQRTVLNPAPFILEIKSYFCLSFGLFWTIFIIVLLSFLAKLRDCQRLEIYGLTVLNLNFKAYERMLLFKNHKY